MKPSSDHFSVIQLVHLDQTGDTLYRMKWPAEALSEIAPEWTVVNLDVNDSRRFEWGLQCDLLVLFQSDDLDLLPLIEKRRQRGLSTLAEYNDNFYSPPVASPVFDAWSSPKTWRSYESVMGAVDGLIVTCEELKKLFQTKTKVPIQVLKNFLPDRELMPFDCFKKKWLSPELNLCWGGSMGHFPDLLASLPTLREILRDFPELHLLIMGNDMIPSHLGISDDRYTFRDWGSMPDYFDFLKNGHLGFVPLLEDPYNRCRSDVKALEMISSGVLPILPDAPPYRDLLSETKLPSYKNFLQMGSLLRDSLSDRGKAQERLLYAYHVISQSRMRSAVQERFEYYARYNKAQLNSSGLDLAAGYHELRSVKPFSPTADLLTQAQKNIDAGDRLAAFKLVDEAYTANQNHIELRLIRLKLLRKINESSWIEEVEMLSDSELADFRIRSMRLEILKDDALQKDLEKLRGDIEALPEFSRKHLIPSIATTLTRLIHKNGELLPSIEKFVPLFENFVPLRLEVAKAMLARNRREEAVVEFQKILVIAETIECSRDAILSLSPAYFRTLVEGARADPAKTWSS